MDTDNMSVKKTSYTQNKLSNKTSFIFMEIMDWAF